MLSIIHLRYIIGIILFSFQVSALEATTVLNSQFSESSNSFTISALPTLPTVFNSLNSNLILEASRTQSTTNFNSEVSDFKILKSAAGLGLQFDWNQILHASAEGSIENVDDKSVQNQLASSSIGLKYANFFLKFKVSDAYIRQKDEYIFFNRDIKEQLTLRKNSTTASLSYLGQENILLTVSYTKYNYDTDVEALVIVTTGKNPLTNNGAGFISQINSLIDTDTRLDFVFNYSDSLDIELAFGQSVDFFDPYTKSRDMRLGSTFYFQQYSVGIGATALESDDDTKTTLSGDLSFSFDI